MPSPDVSTPFGGPVRLCAGEAADLSSPLAAQEDMDLVRRTLLGFNEGGGGFLRFYRPRPTAAFSPRDTTLPNYPQAVEAMRMMGFAPVERRAGGQFAAYDSSALVIDLVAPHEEPREHVLERFPLFSQAIVSALVNHGLDARMGRVAGEYCPGDYSVNVGGRAKLAGVAQRIGRKGYHMGAVLSVTRSVDAESAVKKAYDILGMEFSPDSFGAVADIAPAAGFPAVAQSLLTAFSRCIAVERLAKQS